MKKLILMSLLLLPLAGLAADNNIISNLEFYNTVYRGPEEWHFVPNGKAALSFRSEKNSNVQGHTEIEFYPMDLYGDAAAEVPAIFVKRAYVRTRFPDFRMTLGKTRLAWGQGVVFNAGDVVFGSLNPVLDLTETELRSDTGWLTSFNIPIGNFSFVEGVILPPAIEVESIDSISVGTLDQSSMGGRAYFLAGGIKVEGGYLYKGQKKVLGDAVGHRPYLSLQGNIGPDWYLSSSLAIPTEKQKSDGLASGSWEESWILSLGFFHMQEINRNNTLNLRLETLCFPYQNWEDKGQMGTVYGLYLYPEVSWTTGNGTYYSIQSVISPIDESAMITGGAGWNIYQGLFLVGYATFLVGDENATFAWDRSDSLPSLDTYVNGMSFMTGLRYKF